MDLYSSRTYMQDLDYVIEHSGWLSGFEQASFLITGSSGLICSAVADLLLRYSELHGGSIKVYAAGRSMEKAMQRFSRYYDKPYFQYVFYDARRKNSFPAAADYIIHGASNATPAQIYSDPVDTMTCNFCGMHELLDFASKTHTRNTIFISSSEVYGRKDTSAPFKEDDYGFIDFLNPRSSYSMGKRAAETLCASYYHKQNTPVSIVRPGHIYGPTASRSDNRVSSSFAYAAADGRDLELKSSGAQIRSYCYMLDCATAILKVAASEGRSIPYNVSNPGSVISIFEIAKLFAKAGGVHLTSVSPSAAEQAAFNPMENSSLDSARLLSLGWTPFFEAETGTAHTVQILKECMVPE